MTTPPTVIKVNCVDCDKEMVYFAQGMIRCEDCLYKFIVGYSDDNQNRKFGHSQGFKAAVP